MTLHGFQPDRDHMTLHGFQPDRDPLVKVSLQKKRRLLSVPWLEI